jgi:hypothetical protein
MKELLLAGGLEVPEDGHDGDDMEDSDDDEEGRHRQGNATPVGQVQDQRPYVGTDDEVSVNERCEPAELGEVPDEVGEREVDDDVDGEVPYRVIDERAEPEHPFPFPELLDRLEKTGDHEIQRHEIDGDGPLNGWTGWHGYVLIIIGYNFRTGHP